MEVGSPFFKIPGSAPGMVGRLSIPVMRIVLERKGKGYVARYKGKVFQMVELQIGKGIVARV